ncbi:hypothetical protein MKW98_016353 [Papaver atlanticum]|uniref:Uncharacterized protein n=1 Tax=Papaver atlanticum TaxID=357466 RepID=A0AAD4XEN3_9MAGN|nr:hypothetical protein MKW98_016353 [Papaver atlanticum]
MGEQIQEVVYETRYHAKGSFSSNYPPLQEWDERKNPKRFKEWIPLVVSSAGEYVAEASGNKTTILWKNDDHRNPVAFLSVKLGTFTYGAWSDIHDILGVIDETDTSYIIKSRGGVGQNREEAMKSVNGYYGTDCSG